MNRNDIVDSLGRIDEDMINEVGELRNKEKTTQRNVRVRKPLSSGRRIALAACIILMICSVSMLGKLGHLRIDLGGSGAPIGYGDDRTFMSYAGPVMPITTLENTQGIEIERHVTFDFSDYDDFLRPESEIIIHNSHVTDEYVLTNDSDEKRKLTLYYPFGASLADSPEIVPEVAIDGEAIETDLKIGPFSGGFTGDYGDPDSTETFNLLELHSWEAYKAVLNEGYLRRAIDAYPDASEKVIVYELTDMYAETEDKDSVPNVYMRFNIDPDKTKVLTYGFDGMEYSPETGNMLQSISLPQDGRGDGPVAAAYLMIVGDDIEEYELKGFIWSNSRKELENAGAKVTKYESTVGEMLALTAGKYRGNLEKNNGESAYLEISDEDFAGLAAELLYDNGLLSDDPAEYLYDSSLEDIYGDTDSWCRIIYSSFDVTIPAKSSVTVTMDMVKLPSHDWSGGEISRNGYEILSNVGSTFDLNKQTASVSGTDYIGIISQNLGFDLQEGITDVGLDPEELYYVDICSLTEDGKNITIPDKPAKGAIVIVLTLALIMAIVGAVVLLLSSFNKKGWKFSGFCAIGCLIIYLACKLVETHARSYSVGIPMIYAEIIAIGALIVFVIMMIVKNIKS